MRIPRIGREKSNKNKDYSKGELDHNNIWPCSPEIGFLLFAIISRNVFMQSPIDTEPLN